MSFNIKWRILKQIAIFSTHEFVDIRTGDVGKLRREKNLMLKINK